MRSARSLAWLVVALLGCGRIVARPVTTMTSTTSPAPVELPEGVMRGAFLDDYGNRFEISDTLFAQQPHGRFHIVEWHVRDQFVVARNDDANPSDGGRWTRIDWMRFDGMAPYTWGFCLTAYKAPTREAARATAAADRSTPRTGCNGYPFSRMRPADDRADRLRFPGQPESAQHGRFVMEWHLESDATWRIHRYYRVPLPPNWTP
jgi:hypothetical protein